MGDKQRGVSGDEGASGAQSLYAVLGLTVQATDEEVRRAYYALAKQRHPDTSFSPAESAAFEQIARAAGILRDPGQKWLYDRGEIDEYGRPIERVPPSDAFSRQVVGFAFLGIAGMALIIGAIKIADDITRPDAQIAMPRNSVERPAQEPKTAERLAPEAVQSDPWKPVRVAEPPTDEEREPTLFLQRRPSKPEMASPSQKGDRLRRAEFLDRITPGLKRPAQLPSRRVASQALVRVASQVTRSEVRVPFLPARLDEWPRQCPLTPECKANRTWCDC